MTVADLYDSGNNIIVVSIIFHEIRIIVTFVRLSFILPSHLQRPACLPYNYIRPVNLLIYSTIIYYK